MLQGGSPWSLQVHLALIRCTAPQQPVVPRVLQVHLCPHPPPHPPTAPAGTLPKEIAEVTTLEQYKVWRVGWVGGWKGSRVGSLGGWVHGSGGAGYGVGRGSVGGKAGAVPRWGGVGGGVDSSRLGAGVVHGRGDGGQWER